MCDPGQCQWQRFEDSDRSVLRLNGEVCVSCGATRNIVYRYVGDDGKNHHLENRDGKLQCMQCGLVIRRDGDAVSAEYPWFKQMENVSSVVCGSEPVCYSPKCLPYGVVS